LELDPADVNDIIAALEFAECPQFIVLEDFHYLPEETQRDFAVALKAFHEDSNFCFIVVGVWRDQNRLVHHNGDLTGRVVAIDADQWTTDELREVIESGESYLNITFTDQFKNELLKGCFSNVFVVQESSGRYTAFIINFALGFQTSQLEMFKWLLWPVLTADVEELERGLKYGYLRSTLNERHPAAPINAGNITQALQSVASLQVGRMAIKPIILDYDETNRRLSVVDRSFLIWLQHQDRSELLTLAELPPMDAD
jgi:hypothetical protein